MKKAAPVILALGILAVVSVIALLDRYSPKYDAEYVGAAVCGECHTQIFPEWQRSPHANMLRDASPQSVVGDFENASWILPEEDWRSPLDSEPAARMHADAGNYYITIRDNSCAIECGIHKAPSITLILESDTLVSVIDGSLSGAQAFMFGKVKAEGRLSLATRLSELFSA